jgi:hypothetical protein
MIRRLRLAGITAVLLVLAVSIAFTATQGFLPKYDAGGALVDSIVYEASGNVGIGTSTPVRQLTLNHATAAVIGLYTGGSERALLRGLSDGSLGIDTAGNERVRITGGGNVGIGTATPVRQLTLNHSGDPTLGFYTNGTERAVIRANTTSHLLFDVGNNEAARFTGTGFGIGTTAPQAKLHVAGDIKVDGNIAAKYQDVAEWVPSRVPADAGTVMVVDDERRNGVDIASAAYDIRVAGVVSPRPGITLGEKRAGSALVAQSGRVVVKVDASHGSIKAGDLLVTSSTPGHAMRSDSVTLGGIEMHRPGTILGKALEPLASGTGEILVLLTLQ